MSFQYPYRVEKTSGNKLKTLTEGGYLHFDSHGHNNATLISLAANCHTATLYKFLPSSTKEAKTILMWALEICKADGMGRLDLYLSNNSSYSKSMKEALDLIGGFRHLAAFPNRRYKDTKITYWFTTNASKLFDKLNKE